MHVWLRDVLDDDGDIKIPSTYSLVIGRGNKTAVFVDERDCINGS